MIELLKQHNERASAREIRFAVNAKPSTENEDEILEIDHDNGPDFLIVNANEQAKPVLKKRIFDKRPKLSFCPTDTQEPETFTCDYCMKSFKAKQGLTRHVQSHVKKKFPKHGSSFAVSSLNKLNEHKLQVLVEPLFLNSDGSYKVEKKIDDHAFICFCGASFKTKFSLRAHKK